MIAIPCLDMTELQACLSSALTYLLNEFPPVELRMRDRFSAVCLLTINL